MKYVDDINLKYGGEGTKLYSTAGTRFKTLCIQNDLHLLDASVRHLGTDINYIVLENIYNELKDCSLPLGIWLDSEIADTKNKSGRADKLNKATRTQMLLIIIEKLRVYGLSCGIYASASWFISNLDMSKLQDVPLWVAQWNSTLTFKYPAQLWQYSDNGSIPGINGRVDLDKFVKEEKAPDPELDAAVDVIARRVIKGDFGCGHDNRMLKIYELIRLRVNDILK